MEFVLYAFAYVGILFLILKGGSLSEARYERKRSSDPLYQPDEPK